jgi:hypothetical protein
MSSARASPSTNSITTEITVISIVTPNACHQ